MTGTICVSTSHSLSRSYLNHLAYKINFMAIFDVHSDVNAVLLKVKMFFVATHNLEKHTDNKVRPL
jgi:hypothetical protein